MIELSKDQLRKLQMIELELLVEVDRICKKNGIKYSIIAGTLLGAVRHGGFIPWDDDADVAMLRSEYERFREACKNDLDKTRFVFQDHRNTKGYRWGYGKLRRKDTLFLREHQEHMPYFQGIFIDIFPLDGVPNNYLMRSVQNLGCFCLRKFLWAPVGCYTEKNPLVRKLYWQMKRVPESFLFSVYQLLIRLANRKTTRMVRILMYPTPNDEWGYLRCWYECTDKFIFEGREFQGIRDFDSYLSFKFGDYQSIPAKEKRKTHPVSELRMEDIMI